jgi:hypothetical protein
VEAREEKTGWSETIQIENELFTEERGLEVEEVKETTNYVQIAHSPVQRE